MDFSVVLFDDGPNRESLLPLVATRPIADLRIGILTIKQKWELFTKQDVSYLTTPYLRSKYPLNPLQSTVILIYEGLLPSEGLIEELLKANLNCKLLDESGNTLAVKIRRDDLPLLNSTDHLLFSESRYVDDVCRIVYPEDIFLNNAKQISKDIELLGLTRTDSSIYKHIKVFGDNVYIHPSVELDCAIIDARQGPVVIEEGVVIEPDVFIKGPVFIGRNSRIKSGARLYPNVSIGANCTICGEINNTVIWGNSAKGHDGYLGCAVIGEGCNLGAGTTNSNLKNDWSSVKLYDYSSNKLRDTGLAKCGVVIGDQVMLGIQSKLTTGTVIGVGAQVAMSKFIPKLVPDFSWLTDEKHETYIFDRFVGMLQRKSIMKNEELTEDELRVFEYIHQQTKYLRINNQH